MNDIVPPSNIEIERTVLASMMTENDEVTEYGSDKLTPEDFYHTDNRIVFECIQAMSRSSVSNMSILIVQDALTMQDGIDYDRAMEMVVNISSSETSSSIETHCEILRDKRRQRELLNLCIGS